MVCEPGLVAKDGELAAAKPKTIAEALDKLEGKVGKDCRRILRELGELDDEDDVIDVESK